MIYEVKKILHPLLFFILILLCLISYSSCFDISVSPGNICCGDWITVTISLTNNGDSVFSGRVEIYIIDANGYQNRMDGLSITLQPHESRPFQTRIRPKDCNSYGTYQVVVKLIGDNGQEQTRTSSFVVKNPASCQGSSGGSESPGCTWTFTCENNVVKRLCIDQNGREYWKEYDNCNNYNPPRSCINGVCVEISPTCNQQTCPPPNQCINGICVEKPLCDQQACQNQNKVIGKPYIKNGATYQRYMECYCVANSCQCNQVEREVPKPKCSGTISGHVYNVDTKSPIPGAAIWICPSEGDCWSPPLVNSVGVYETEGETCPSTAYEITCSADGYKYLSKTVTTDEKGNAWQNFELEPESRETAIILKNHKFTDYIPNAWDNLMRFFGANLEVNGRLDATLEPKEKIKNAKVEVKLGYVKAQHLSIFAEESKNFDIFGISDDNAIPASFKQYVEWETKTFDMTGKDGVYSAELVVDATSFADIIKVLYMVYGGAESLLEEALGKVFPVTPDYGVYLTGDEPVYMYAEITKISGIDTFGNEFECPINEKIKTTFHKKVIALKEDTLEKLARATKEGYISY